MPNKAIIITTINPPSKAVIAFSKLSDFTLYIAGDNKGPKTWDLKEAVFLPMAEQQSQFPKFAKLVAENHYARKNVAYAKAIQDGVERIYESDDDNIPYDFFPQFKEEKFKVQEITAETAFNIYSLFTHKNIWPRGLPLNKVKQPHTSIKDTEVQPLIQQSLADSDPDVDAIYRLVIGDLVTFDKDKVFSLAKGTYCPFNSQNTYWHKKMFPVLYLPSTVESRVTDIWRGYIAQRILWEAGSELVFSSASVYQDRNVHNYMKDFMQELELYTRTEDLLQTLNDLALQGEVSDMLLTVYKELVAKKFVQESELAIVNQWLTEIS
jgi:hypothetical protein